MTWLQRLAGLPADRLMRNIGLAACALNAILAAIWCWLNGSRAIAYNGTWIGQLARWSSGIPANLPASLPTGQESQLLHAFILLDFGCMASFAVAFWLRSTPSIGYAARTNAILLTIQIAIGLLGDTDLLYIVAVELAFLLPARSALIWLGAQMTLLAISSIPFITGAGGIEIVCNAAGITPPSMMMEKALEIAWEIAWQTFAFCCGYIVSAELRTRVDLAGIHAELLATQQFLKDALRTSERVRIARDLHDAIGHQLTALNLHLNLAERQHGSHDNPSLQTARQLAQRLLSKVRAVVSIERKNHGVDLRHALQTFCASMPMLRLTLAFDDTLRIDSPALAHAVFRSVQAAIAAIDSRSAATLHIAISGDDDALLLALSPFSATGTATHGNGLQTIGKQLAAQDWNVQILAFSDADNTLRLRFPFSGNLP